MSEILADLVCMVYHEGRNVRHPVQKKLISEEEWPRFRALISLPRNREDAWRLMQPIRAEAAIAKSPAACFERQYGIDIRQLAELFARPIWRGSATGGNKWAAIARQVEQLLEVHADGASRGGELIQEILAMDHNTGNVRDKLQKLNAICEGS